jgi:hypothetical protein
MSLIDELLEYSDEDKKIVKSFKTKDSLSDSIFMKSDGEFLMRNDVRKSLLEIADNFIDSLGVDFFIHDIILTGSLSNYNWSEYSDVDLHILIDFNEIGDNLNDSITQKIFKEFFDAKKNIWNENHDVKIKGYDVEIYVQDVNEKHESTGIYSILNNKWIIKPEKKIHKIDEDKILKKGEDYIKKIDLLYNKMKSGINVIDEITKLKDKLKEFRKSGLEKGGEYSYENLTFKLLRRNGYIEKLLDMKNHFIDKKLSIR